MKPNWFTTWLGLIMFLAVIPMDIFMPHEFHDHTTWRGWLVVMSLLPVAIVLHLTVWREKSKLYQVTRVQLTDIDAQQSKHMESMGVYSTVEAAKQRWKELSWANIDDAHRRYIIEERLA